MRILLTNDDGVHSPGILLLAEALRKAGHWVFVLAPASNQSGVSHAVGFFHGPLKLSEVGENIWSCSGTPADCVVVALGARLEELCVDGKFVPPDIVVSGINRGANLGTDIVYSGTASAARQGAFHNIPSLAFSLVEGDDDQWNWAPAVAFATERLEQALGYWKPNTFININMPNRLEKPLDLVHAFPSVRCYNDSMETYHAPDGRRYCFSRTEKATAQAGQGSDWATVMENNAALSEIYIHPVMLESVREPLGSLE